MKGVQCGICPHRCTLKEGQTGLCRARINKGGKIICENYGLVTSIALDPIEKKPLYRFYPGSRILSVGSYGCNFRCGFCQNHDISMADHSLSGYFYIAPKTLATKALALIPQGNIGVAFTYNEPLVGYEYVYDCAALNREKGLKSVLVTNGFINEQPLLRLLTNIDAMNIDLKSFSEEFYKKVGGELEAVKRTIELCAKACHVEVTTLIIPGENDSEDEMRRLSQWLAGVDPKIPFHVTRFFPRYKMADKTATDVAAVKRLAQIAGEALEYVYAGNC
jgi:pyruvate formate lyase activating enzyme